MSYWEENADRVGPGQVFTTEDGGLVLLVEHKDYFTWEVDKWNGSTWIMHDDETLTPFSITLSELRDKMPDGYYPSHDTPNSATAQTGTWQWTTI